MDKDSFISTVRSRQKEMSRHIPVLRDLPADAAGTFAKCEVIAFIMLIGGWLDQLDRDALGPEEKADTLRQDAENENRWRDDPIKRECMDSDERRNGGISDAEYRARHARYGIVAPPGVPAGASYCPVFKVWHTDNYKTKYDENGVPSPFMKHRQPDGEAAIWRAAVAISEGLKNSEDVG